MSTFTSEFLGTAMLVLLGNSLASAVLLSRTRAENAGWMAVSLKPMLNQPVSLEWLMNHKKVFSIVSHTKTESR